LQERALGFILWNKKDRAWDRELPQWKSEASFEPEVKRWATHQRNSENNRLAQPNSLERIEFGPCKQGSIIG
jgi:hypothetical protein